MTIDEFLSVFVIASKETGSVLGKEEAEANLGMLCNQAAQRSATAGFGSYENEVADDTPRCIDPGFGVLVFKGQPIHRDTVGPKGESQVSRFVDLVKERFPLQWGSRLGGELIPYIVMPFNTDVVSLRYDMRFRDIIVSATGQEINRSAHNLEGLVDARIAAAISTYENAEKQIKAAYAQPRPPEAKDALDRVAVEIKELN